MSDLSFNSFFNGAQPFGLNVKVPERTIQQLGKTAGDLAGGVLDPIFSYLEENENVFNGDIVHETERMRATMFNIANVMGSENIKINGESSFNANF